MDKNAAVQFIQAGLDQNHSRAEIAKALGQELKAPQEMVARFVQQVADSYTPPPPPPEEISPEPTPELQPEPISDSPPAPVRPRNTGEVPSWIIDMEAAVAAGAPAVLPEETVAPKPQPKPETGQPPRPADSPLPDHIAVDQVRDEPEVDLDGLSEAVLERLKKQRRHNDIVEYVCHKTGWHWNKSQRFVARVQTQNHKVLMGGQNRLIIFVGVLTILGGIGAIGWGASMTWGYISALMAGAIGVTLRVELLIYGLSLIGTGLGMIVGGGFGISRSLSNR